MSTQLQQVQKLDDLSRAYDGSWYTICGAGGDLNEWVTGLTGLMAAEGIGSPTAWFTFTGADINRYAGPNNNPFADDLTVLAFPLDGLNVGRLSLFRLHMQDRWFDDIINNMRVTDWEEEL